MDMCLIYQQNISFLLQVDMMQYTSKKVSIKQCSEYDGSIVYFDINKYAIGEDGFDGKPFQQLAFDMCNKAIKSAFYLMRNGFKARQGLFVQEFTGNRYQLCKGGLKKRKESTTVGLMI